MTESGYWRPLSGDKAAVCLEAGQRLASRLYDSTVRSRELEGVVLLCGQIGLGYRQAGRVNRHDAVLFRDGWNARPSCDDENGYDSNA